MTLTSFMTLTSYKSNQVDLLTLISNDPMTLILKLYLDIAKMYHHTKNEVSMSTASKVIARTETHRHTHTHDDENITSTAYAVGNNGIVNYVN